MPCACHPWQLRTAVEGRSWRRLGDWEPQPWKQERLPASHRRLPFLPSTQNQIAGFSGAVRPFLSAGSPFYMTVRLRCFSSTIWILTNRSMLGPCTCNNQKCQAPQKPTVGIACNYRTATANLRWGRLPCTRPPNLPPKPTKGNVTFPHFGRNTSPRTTPCQDQVGVHPIPPSQASPFHGQLWWTVPLPLRISHNCLSFTTGS
ncbi:hypothetical protein VTK56DRAFT_2905 [Thermocarpiscus australiensis]